MEIDKNREKILVSHINIRQSISVLVIKLIAIDAIAASGVAALYIADLSLTFDFSSLPIFIFLVSLKIAVTTFVVLEWLNEYYEITPQAVIYKRGVIFKTIKRFALEKVRKIVVKQGVLGRMLNYGTLTLLDIRFIKYLDLYLIHNPMRYCRILEELIPNLEEEKEILREHIVEYEED